MVDKTLHRIVERLNNRQYSTGIEYNQLKALAEVGGYVRCVQCTDFHRVDNTKSTQSGTYCFECYSDLEYPENV